MDKEEENRLYKISKEVYLNNLDIGYAQMPNPFLIHTVGLDINYCDKPHNYKSIFVYNGKTFPFKDNSFDSITAGELIEHIDNVGLFLDECYRVLKPKGKLILSTPNPYFISEIIYNVLPFKKDLSPFHINLFPKRALKRHLKLNGFNLIKMYGTGIVIPIRGTHFDFNFTDFLTKNFIYVCKKERENDSKK